MKKLPLLFLLILLSSCANPASEQVLVRNDNNLKGKFLHLKDADIYYQVFGKGKPLFLLHGNGGSMNSFAK